MTDVGRRSGRGSRLVRWLAAAAAAGVLVAGGYWAGRVTLSPPVAANVEVETALLTVDEATVGRSLSLNVTVERPFVAVATNGLAGTVTSVATLDQVDIGDVLYSVNTVPVRAVVGDTPFWRDLSFGAVGDDVAQLQQALAELGYYAGEPDGRFQGSTAQAVREWQRALGLQVTGTVALGEIVAVPELPAALQLADGIATGVRVAGGEPAVSAATGEVRFRLVVSSNQAGLIPPDATVAVAHDDQFWPAVLGESVSAEDGNIHFTLTAPDGGLVCGGDCDRLPAVERTSLRAQVTIIPEVSGPAVPVAAVHTDPDGTAWVRMADGTRREVTVLGSSGGVAVVDGLATGERVQVLGAAGGEPGPQPSPAGEE